MIRLSFISRSSLAFLALLLGLILFLPAKAHSVVANMSGTVKDSEGNLLPKATLTIANEEGETATGKTDEAGAFFIPLEDRNWKSGQYTVTVKYDDRTVSKPVTLGDGPNQVEDIIVLLSLATCGRSDSCGGG